MRQAVSALNSGDHKHVFGACVAPPAARTQQSVVSLRRRELTAEGEEVAVSSLPTSQAYPEHADNCASPPSKHCVVSLFTLDHFRPHAAHATTGNQLVNCRS